MSTVVKVDVSDGRFGPSRILVEVHGASLKDLAKTVAAVTQAAGATAVHLDGRGIGAGLADYAAPRLKAAGIVTVAHYDGPVTL